eukprot:1447650-Rhodomonas_salina.1
MSNHHCKQNCNPARINRSVCALSAFSDRDRRCGGADAVGAAAMHPGAEAGALQERSSFRGRVGCCFCVCLCVVDLVCGVRPGSGWQVVARGVVWDGRGDVLVLSLCVSVCEAGMEFCASRGLVQCGLGAV